MAEKMPELKEAMGKKEIDLHQFYRDPVKFQTIDFKTADTGIFEKPLQTIIAIQSQINRRIIDKEAMAHVYDIHTNDRYEWLLQLLEKFKTGDIYDMTHLQIDDQVVLTNVARIPARLKGYHTYGDFEDCFAVVLAPIVDFDQFSRIIDQIKEKLENISQRIGLGAILKKRMSLEFTELAKIGIRT